MGGSSGCVRTPALITAPAFTAFGVGDVHRCGRTASGTLYCWGANYDGWFGNGTTTGSDSPTLAGGGAAYTQLAVGRVHTCGLDAASGAHCWGANSSGQIGDGTNAVNRLSPVAVVGGHRFTALVSGGSSEATCGIDTAGRAYCWGDGRFGQVGDGEMSSRAQPVQVRLPRREGRVQ
jgi:alpha-tubulin suppressor-like RCC1 family protein